MSGKQLSWKVVPVSKVVKIHPLIWSIPDKCKCPSRSTHPSEVKTHSPAQKNVAELMVTLSRLNEAHGRNQKIISRVQCQISGSGCTQTVSSAKSQVLDRIRREFIPYVEKMCWRRWNGSPFSKMSRSSIKKLFSNLVILTRFASANGYVSGRVGHSEPRKG